MEKPLREWTEADVVALVRSGRIEGPTLEYKASLYDTNDRGSREFLLDICSMANSNGGLLLIGVAEQRDENGPTGAPDANASLGVECDNPEQLLTSSESRILEAIDQRLLVESHAINLGSGRRVLVFRVPDSLDKPHRVAFQGRTSFPARRERQRYELNATEIKELVMRAASRIDAAEVEINRALSGAVGPHENPIFAVALMPVFTRNLAVDFRSRQLIHAFAQMNLVQQESGTYIQPVFSMEGLTRQGLAPGVKVSLGHNGLLLLSMRIPSSRSGGLLSFNPLTVDIYIRGMARGCRVVYSVANLAAPLLLGAAIKIPEESLAHYGGVFDDPNRVESFTRIYPSLVLQSLADPDPQIRPLCDLIHQSFGESHSPAFDGAGNWIYSRDGGRG
jgi:hypothetical protein